MGRSDGYRAELRALRRSDWEAYLVAGSGLPGPRGNLELAQAAADEASPSQLRRLAASEDEYLALCGAVGLGRLLAEGDTSALATLRALSSDARWRVREGVAMGLQRWGATDMDALIREMDGWAKGTPFEQRAVAAALCEPALLRDPKHGKAVLGILDGITASVEGATERRNDGFRALRQGLGYCWSVAVAADPDDGKWLVERWCRSKDRDVRWIMRENLKKDRLARMDTAWVERTRRLLG